MGRTCCSASALFVVAAAAAAALLQCCCCCCCCWGVALLAVVVESALKMLLLPLLLLPIGCDELEDTAEDALTTGVVPLGVVELLTAPAGGAAAPLINPCTTLYRL